MHRWLSIVALCAGAVACSASEEQKWTFDGRFDLPCSHWGSDGEEREVCVISAVQLIANIERYHNRRIRVAGMLHWIEGRHFLSLIGCESDFYEGHMLELIGYDGWVPVGVPLEIDGLFDGLPEFGMTVGSLSDLEGGRPTSRQLVFSACTNPTVD